MTFGSARGLCSALGFHHLWGMSLRHPGLVTSTVDIRGCLMGDLTPNESVEYRRMIEGMARRMGDNPTPPTPLRRCHICWIVRYLEGTYQNSSSLSDKLHTVRCALVVLIAWLAWLRSSELFSLTIGDVIYIAPHLGPSVGLPQSIGAVGLLLLPGTKGSQRVQADVWVTHTTSSGLSLGTWWSRFVTLQGSLQPDHLIFINDDGVPWTSSYFCLHYLYPWLSAQQLEGDIYLRTGGADNLSIPERFYSFGVFRRGGRLDVSDVRAGSHRKATKEEINEHGRWRYRKAADMQQHYLQWGVEEKIKLTLFAM